MRANRVLIFLLSALLLMAFVENMRLRREVRALREEARTTRLLHDDLAHYVHGPAVAYGDPDGE